MNAKGLTNSLFLRLGIESSLSNCVHSFMNFQTILRPHPSDCWVRVGWGVYAQTLQSRLSVKVKKKFQKQKANFKPVCVCF